MKKRMQNTRSCLPIGSVLLAAVLAAALFLGGIWLGTARASQSSVPQSDGTAQWPEVYHTDDQYLTVDTPWGELRYDAVFEEFLRISCVLSRGRYDVRFDADLGIGETVNIFTVVYAADDGTMPEGDIIGVVGNADGADYLVTLCINQALPRSDWDADTKDLVCAMQEGIQTCAESVTGQSGFRLES